jgi:GNAT superfamily N-acetyltransferase
VTVRVRPVERDELATFVEIRNAVTPDWGTSLDEIEWADRTYPGAVRHVAELDGRPVGVANGGRIYIHEPDYRDWWAEVTVLPDARRRGAGRALLRAVSGAARMAGKSGLQLPVSEARPEGMAFLVAHGFEEFERSKAVRLDLDPAAAAAVEAPPGVDIVSLADRPDLVEAIHGVALRTLPEIPGGDPMAVGDLAEFLARDVDRPSIPRDGFFLALVDGGVVGYASLVVDPGRPRIAYHDMTVVLPEQRGRGIAGALKRAAIRWAAKAGLEALETGNDEANAAMRAVNARLGYRPLPDLVFFRGPLLEDPPG